MRQQTYSYMYASYPIRSDSGTVMNDFTVNYLEFCHFNKGRFLSHLAALSAIWGTFTMMPLMTSMNMCTCIFAYPSSV